MKRSEHSGGGRSWSGRDYRRLEFTSVSLLKDCCIGVFGVLLTDYLCFRSRLFLILILPAGAFSSYHMAHYRARRRRELLSRQFRETLLALGNLLEAGYALEPALKRAEQEMRELYGDQADMTLELERINKRLTMNVTAEEAFEDLAVRSGLEDVRSFSQVFAAARRGSGSLGQIVALTARTLSRKQRTEEEIKTMTAARQLEQRILFAMPLVLLAYQNLTSPGVLEVMYETTAGRVVMGACLLAGLGAWQMAERIMEIEV